MSTTEYTIRRRKGKKTPYTGAMATPWYKKARTALKARNLHYADVAEICDVTTAAVGHWMTARNRPRIEHIKKIAGMVGMTVSELIEEDAYFILDDKERRAIDAFRGIPVAEQEKALKILDAIRESSAKPEKSAQ